GSRIQESVSLVANRIGVGVFLHTFHTQVFSLHRSVAAGGLAGQRPEKVSRGGSVRADLRGRSSRVGTRGRCAWSRGTAGSEQLSARLDERIGTVFRGHLHVDRSGRRRRGDGRGRSHGRNGGTVRGGKHATGGRHHGHRIRWRRHGGCRRDELPAERLAADGGSRGHG